MQSTGLVASKDDNTPQIEDGVPGGESIHTDPEGHQDPIHTDPEVHQDPFFCTINHVMTKGCPFQTVQKLHSKIKNKH